MSSSPPTARPGFSQHEVGLAILGPLRELDEVAYLRFASVYRGFESIDDFEKEIESLRAAERGRRGIGQTNPRLRGAPRRGGDRAARHERGRELRTHPNAPDG